MTENRRPFLRGFCSGLIGGHVVALVVLLAWLVIR